MLGGREAEGGGPLPATPRRVSGRPRRARGAGQGCGFDLGTDWKHASASLDLPTSLPKLGPSWGAYVIVALLLEIVVKTPGPTVKTVNTLISVFCRGHQPKRQTLGDFKAQGTSIPRICCVAGIGVPQV